MATNAFLFHPKKPTEAEVANELGVKKALWDESLTELAELGATDQEWSSYSLKAGWALKVIRKKRTIVYLSPMHGSFFASFILGGKAIAAARETKLPKKALQLIDEGQRYPEGTGVRVDVKTRADVSIVKKLAEVKIAH